MGIYDTKMKLMTIANQNICYKSVCFHIFKFIYLCCTWEDYLQ
jgi:hypothetical protein